MPNLQVFKELKSTNSVIEKENILLKSKDDAEILRNAIADPAWSINALVAALGARGVTLSRTVIERHRGKRCPCSKI